MALRRSLGLAVLLLIAGPGMAADSRPIEISVDLTDAPRKIFRARLVIIPTEPRPLIQLPHLALPN